MNLAPKTLVAENTSNTVDAACKVIESWDNRLDFPPTKIPERYVSGDLAIRIEGSAKAGNLDFGKVVISLEHQVKASLPASVDMKSADCQNEFTMLVDHVHFVNDSERMAFWARQQGGRTMVRLQLLDDRPSRLGDPLYFSLVTGAFRFVSGGMKEDREFDCCRRLRASLQTRKLPSDMIQAGPQLMDDLSAQNAEADRDFSFGVEFDRFLKGFRIILGDSFIRPIFEESINFSFEVHDVLVGSL